jgi:pyruvate carboxylase subunit B
LKEQKALEKYNDVLKETPKVREDLGYPPLVTPTSQIVGTQAVLNVVTGERYKIIPKEVKDYVKGLYGQTPGPIKDEIRKKIIGDEKPIDCRPADLLEPEWEKLKAEAEKLGIVKKEEDIITYALYPAVAPRFLKGEAVEEQLPSPEMKVAAAAELVEAQQYKVKVGKKSFDVFVEKFGGPGEVTPVRRKVKGPRAKTMTRQVKKEAGRGTTPAARVMHKEGTVVSPMQGAILKISVTVGDKVKAGDVIAILEAMKMENEVCTNLDGVVKEIYVKEGQTVESGVPIALIE